jgi:hypothetical protein
VTPGPQRLALYGLAALAASGWIAASCAARRADRIQASDAVQVLQARGYRELKVSRTPPKDLRPTGDLPPGARHVASITLDAPPVEPSPPTVRPVECPSGGWVQVPSNWTLRPGDLGLETTSPLHIAEAGGRALATWEGQITAQTPDGPVVRPVSTEAEIAGWVSSAAVKWPRWEARLGADSEARLVGGVSRYGQRRRLGWWVDAAANPWAKDQDPTGSGGVSLRW